MGIGFAMGLGKEMVVISSRGIGSSWCEDNLHALSLIVNMYLPSRAKFDSTTGIFLGGDVEVVCGGDLA